jgi:iduronate 2-sulfatase
MKKTSTIFCFNILCWGVSLFASDKPNILFIAIDDLKPTLGAYGHALATPAIDRIAAKGTTFLNAHCQQAVCGPSRASVMTGKYPDFTKVWDLKTKIRTIHPEITTLNQHFKNNGYHSVGVGKIFDPRSVDKGADTQSWSEPFTQNWHLKYNPKTGKPVGHYHNAKSRSFAGNNNNNWNALNKQLFANNAWPAVEAIDVPDDAYDDGAIGAHAVKKLAKLAKRKEPFFFSVGFKKPHLPFVAPKKYWDQIDPEKIEISSTTKAPLGTPRYAVHNFSELRSYNGIPTSGAVDTHTQRILIHGYYACVAYIDAQIGKILDELKKQKLAENTIIVLWGDHGWHLGDHGLWCKHTNYEQATRVPLIISIPNGIQQVTTMPTELVDLFPTLCELSDLTVPKYLDGISLAPLIQGNDLSEPPRLYAISQFPKGTRMGYALRNERYRYIAWYETGGIGAQPNRPIDAAELYDYKMDPQEQRNLVNDPKYKETIEQLSAELNNFLYSLQSK